jgi:hypothetical protein
MFLFPVVVAIIFFVLIMIYFLRSRLDKDNPKATGIQRNNPLVLVKDMDPGELKKQVLSFCKTYSRQNYHAVFRITAVSESMVAISFPKKIEFELLCYFICFLQNPANADLKPNVAGWTRASLSDPWINHLSMNKAVMLFTTADGIESNAIFLTTSDNIGFKLNLAPGGTELLLDNPVNQFFMPPIGMSDLSGKHFEDIV